MLENNIFVDDMCFHGINQSRKYGMKLSHMFCVGNIKELHVWAEWLGLGRKCFYGPPIEPWCFYLVSMGKRKKAIIHGAHEISFYALPFIVPFISNQMLQQAQSSQYHYGNHYRY